MGECLKAGADVSLVTGDSGMPPLLHFCERGQCAAASTLLSQGADADAVDKEGRTALLIALQHWGGDLPEDSKKVKAAQKLIKALLAAGADVNKQDAATGKTPLLVSIECKAWDVAKVLLRAGADPSIPDKEGNLCLTTALGLEMDPALVGRLVSAGADVNERSGPTGQTPLHAVVANDKNYVPRDLLQLEDRRHSMRAVKTLLDAGADVNAQDNEGRTCLCCLTTPWLDMVNSLVAAGADLNGRDRTTGQTVLLKAVLINATEINWSRSWQCVLIPLSRTTLDGSASQPSFKAGPNPMGLLSAGRC